MALLAGLALFLMHSQPPQAGSNNVFIYAKPHDAVTLDPADLADTESATVTASIYDTLVQFGPDGDIRPGLATSWRSSADGRSWTFQLRPGVRFHDGTPCDAAAIKLNFDRQRDPASPYRFGGKFTYWSLQFGHVQAIRAPHPATVVFELARPDARLLADLATFANGIVSPAALRTYGAGIGRHPVGTGPFRFLSWTPGEKIVLQANPDYWGGPPRSARLIFQTLPEDSVRLMELQSGHVHGIEGINADSLPRIGRDPNLRLLSRPGMNLAFLAFNTRRPALRDPRVRRAIALALDRDRLRRSFFAGGAVAQAPHSLLPPQVWSYDDAPAPPPDPAAARRQLAAAGFPRGLTLTLWAPPISRPYLPDGRKVAQAVQAQLEQAGIHTRIVTYEWGTYLAKTSRGEHDLLLGGWSSETADPDDFLYTLLHSANAIPGRASNKAFYRNPSVDKLLDQGRITLDRKRRLAIYHQLQAIVRQDVPYFPLFTVNQLAAVRRNVSGFTLQASGIKDFRKVEVTPE